MKPSHYNGLVSVFNGEKRYHLYLSDSMKHDQVFVQKVLEALLSDTEIPLESAMVIESDNCTSQ